MRKRNRQAKVQNNVRNALRTISSREPCSSLSQDHFEAFLGAALSVWSSGLQRQFAWEKEIQALLEGVRVTFGFDWVGIFRVVDEKCLRLCAEEPTLQGKIFPTDVVLDEFPWFQEQIRRGEVFFVSCCAAGLFQKAPQEGAFLASRSVLSLLGLPLLVNGSLFGVLLGVNTEKEKVWSEEGKRYLEWLKRFLVLLVETRQRVEHMQQEGYFLHLVLENMPDVIALKDSQSRFLWTSAFHCRIMGVSRVEDVVGKTDFDFFPSEEAKAFYQDEQEIVKTGKPIVNKLEKAHFQDGTVHWMLTTKVPVRDEHGGIVGILALARDVTELRQIQEDLALRKQFLSIVLNAIPDAVYVKDRNHRFLLVNEADARHHGFSSPQEMVGKTDFDLHPLEFAQKYWEEEERMFATGETILNDERQVNDFSTGKKRKIWVSANKAPLYDEKKKIVGMVGVSRDITERKEMEEALRASEREKDLILNALQDQVTYYDSDLRIVWVNRAVFDNFGLVPKDIIGQYCYRVIEGRTTPCPGCAVVRALQTKKPEEGEVVSRNTTVWHQKAYPILDERGQVFRVVEISVNITERKKIEEQIRYLSFHDPLTGLYNRFFFQEELKRLDVPRQLPLSIIMGDVNNLKLVNDAFGHETGDELLRRMASILMSACRKEDVITRWGGDEFLILLPRTPASAAREIVERIRHLCREDSKKDVPYIPLSISLGYATKEKSEEDIRGVLNEAESRMYRNKLVESRSARSVLIVSLERSLWEISEETEVHSQRLKDIALKMGTMLGLSTTELDALELLARLHDLGKLGVARSILTKPGPLDEKEWEEIKRHPEIGYRIAQASPELLPVAEGILTHHERFDGSGYPQGLKGEEIPLIARIIAIVDAFDAMTSTRPYRRSLTREEAFREIRKNAGTQFDPFLVEVFFKVMKENAE